jgi:hypothetical protein
VSLIAQTYAALLLLVMVVRVVSATIIQTFSSPIHLQLPPGELSTATIHLFFNDFTDYDGANIGFRGTMA